ncbi:MAG: BMP family ABC transporter substrate-binding protein [Chloroflexi bacterium]|nr:BMP family ABC transporter substrate-binding protein [Chloroflexota bacterium]
MKHLLTRLLVLALVLSVVGAGLGTSLAAESDSHTASVERQGALRIGLITDVGEIDDKSFNQSAWEGVLRAEAELGAEVDFIETQDAVDYASNIAEFADQGYDIIVTVGFALGEATLQASQDYPDIHFIGVDQFQGEPVDNVTGLIFNEDKAGFLAGVLAAGVTQSGTIAAVLGTDQVPPVVAFKEGYESGAEWAAAILGKDISYISTYHPGGLDVAFTDPQWGASTAAQAMDQGADVVFAAGGKTGNGGLIEVANAVSGANPPFCIGVDTDQWQTVPEAHPCLVSSAMKLIDKGVFDLITQYNLGTIQGGNFVGDVALAPFYDFEASVPDDVKALLARAEGGLRSGAVLTCYNLDLSGINIGLVTDVGEIDDGSFNESSWNGVLATASCGANVEFIETQDAVDYAGNIAEFAEQGFDVIVTVGFALGEATIQAAQDYPDVYFIGVDQFQVEPVEGVTGLIFREDQAGYLAGVLAANLTESNVVAQVLGTDQVPPVVAFAEGFEFGVAATNADIEVITTYHPGGLDVAFTDPAWGAQTAAQSLDQGADVIFGAGGKTGNGALIEVANAAGAGNPPFCIGVDTDQWLTVPEAHPCLVSSAMKLLDAGVATLLVQWSNGSIQPGNYVGLVGLAPFHDFEGAIPAELAAQLDQLAQDLASGAVTTGYGQ